MIKKIGLQHRKGNLIKSNKYHHLPALAGRILNLFYFTQGVALG
jgi:hypothetical protein